MPLEVMETISALLILMDETQGLMLLGTYDQ